MEQNYYIRVKDSHGKWNIWQIIDEIELNEKSMFVIRSRTTIAFINKDYCFCEYGSSLLYYDNGDDCIDVEESNIEYETKKEYQKWLKNQNKNINPFVKIENYELDFGYLEDMSEEEKWEHLQRSDNYL